MTDPRKKAVKPANNAAIRKPAPANRQVRNVQENPERTQMPVKTELPAEQEVPEVKEEIKESETSPDTKTAQKTAQKPPRISKFTRILIIWLVLLTVVIGGALIWFDGFLERYEELYQVSLPYHQADKTIELFANQDLEALWGLVKDRPQLSEFENETTIKNYIKSLIQGREFTYKQTEDYSESAPEYYIISGNEILAKLKLSEDETNKYPYGFKAWKADKLEFYSSANNKFKVTIPEGYRLSVNGIDVPVAYRSEVGTEPEENKYLKPYAQLPMMYVYEASGLYGDPVIKVTDSEGKEVKTVKDEATGEYKVEIRYECSEEDRKEIEKFGISFTKDFASYISQDAGNYALDKYFPSNSTTLRDIKRNSSREWYTKHGKVDLKNEEVKDFICYTKDIVYIEVYVEQHMEMFWGSKEREVVKTTAHLYLARIKGKWKVAGIRY